MTFPNPNSAGRIMRAGLFIFAAGATSTSLACSVCGCSLSSDWPEQGYPDFPGLVAGVRYEYFDNVDLRSGSHRVAVGSFELPNEVELQRETLNRNVWLDLDYVRAGGWALRAQLPYEHRYHSTIGEGDTELSESRGSGLGDIRVLARYNRFNFSRGVSVQFGLKLPTGRFDQNFATGPASGSLLDRGLQLGAGTTDLLAGVAYFGRPVLHVGWFAQLLLDQPLAQRDGFAPGTSVGFNTGVRYLNESRFTPQVQLNVRWDGREHGANSDAANSGATLLYASPGFTFETSARSNAFVFVQIPLRQRVNGLQLEPHAIVSLGLTWRL